MIEKFRGVSVASISDAFDRLELGGVILGIGPLWDGATVVGPAVTIKFDAHQPETNSSKILSAEDIMEQCESGSVLVISNVGDLDACWGGNLSARSKHKRIAGVVIEGGSRDKVEITELRFPVFARVVSPRVTRRVVANVNQPVQVGGVLVRPGDIIVADADGIACVPKEEANEILDLANRKEKTDTFLKRLIAKGVHFHEAWQQATKRAGW